MCLKKLKEFRVRPTHTDGSVKGWKVFKRRDGKLVGDCKGDRKKRGWNKASFTEMIGLAPEYRSGYHIFTNKKGVEDWSCSTYRNIVVPVYYMPKDVVAKGVQAGWNCVVVSRIWIDPHDYDAAVKKRK